MPIATSTALLAVSGDWGSLPIAGGLEVAYKSEMEAAEDPQAHAGSDPRTPQPRAPPVPYG
jgi:hypothetical protein